MKKLTIALASAAALIAGPALAADLAVRPITKAPAYVPAPYFNWSGIYIGGGVGGMWEDTTGNFYNAGPTFGFNTTRDTGVGGVHGGIQWQTGMFVFGAEAGWLGTWNDNFGTTVGDSGGAPFACGFVAAVQSCQSRINDIFYAGGKLGLAWDRFMVYGTGGYANAEIESRGIINATGVAFSQATRNHSGWFAGAGVDVMAWSLGGADVILGVDYKHFEFDDGNHDIAAAPADSRRLRTDADVFMGRVTFKFNPFRGPIAASY